MTLPPSDPRSRHASGPRVSVVMPVYNAAPHLGAAIESILGQTFGDFEFLILDDGSTDGSGAIVEEFAAKDPRIRFVSRENRGVAATANELAAMARGEFLARMDADDIARADRLAVQLARLDAAPEIDVLGGFVRFIDGAGRPVVDTRLPTTHEEIDAQNLVGRCAIMNPTVTMRRAAFEAVGGYDPTLETSEDLDLWLRMAERGRLANHEGVVLDYRFHAGGISARKQETSAARNRRVCEAAWARRGLPPQDWAYRPWRPGSGRAARRDFALKWAWQARKFGYPATARHYFLEAFRLDPLSRAAWKGVLFGALRDRGRG